MTLTNMLDPMVHYIPTLLDHDRTIAIYEQLKITHCKFCNHVLPQKIWHYDHPSGWNVTGMPRLQWLYIQCENPKCNFQWSLWKLGYDKTQ